jgi:uncharacterized membrane protein YqjE
MIHPLLRLIASKPDLLGDHVHAYSDLISAEISKTSRRWISTAVFYGAAAFLLLLGLIFLGIALMLWAVVPADDMNLPWLLILVPVVPIGAGVFCVVKARAEPKETAFETLKEQVKSDVAMLREVGAAS